MGEPSCSSASPVEAANYSVGYVLFDCTHVPEWCSEGDGVDLTLVPGERQKLSDVTVTSSQPYKVCAGTNDIFLPAGRHYFPDNTNVWPFCTLWLEIVSDTEPVCVKGYSHVSKPETFLKMCFAAGEYPIVFKYGGITSLAGEPFTRTEHVDVLSRCHWAANRREQRRQSTRFHAMHAEVRDDTVRFGYVTGLNLDTVRADPLVTSLCTDYMREWTLETDAPKFTATVPVHDIAALRSALHAHNAIFEHETEGPVVGYKLRDNPLEVAFSVFEDDTVPDVLTDPTQLFQYVPL